MRPQRNAADHELLAKYIATNYPLQGGRSVTLRITPDDLVKVRKLTITLQGGRSVTLRITTGKTSMWRGKRCFNEAAA